MKVTWLGTASILLEDGDRKILFDPYLKMRNPLLPLFPLDDIGDVDAIFITHPHFDHFADMKAVMEHCQAPVYVCERGLEIAREQNYEMKRMRRIAPEDEIRLGGLRVRAYRSCHCMYDKPVVRETVSRTMKPPHLREGLSIEKLNHHFRIDMQRDVLAFEVTNALRSVFLLGSANCCGDVAYPMNMDLLIYPYQGRSDMQTYSVQFLDRFMPRRVMLDHFDDAFPPITAQMDCTPFVRQTRLSHPDIQMLVPKELIAYEV